VVLLQSIRRRSKAEMTPPDRGNTSRETRRLDVIRIVRQGETSIPTAAPNLLYSCIDSLPAASQLRTNEHHQIPPRYRILNEYSPRISQSPSECGKPLRIQDLYLLKSVCPSLYSLISDSFRLSSSGPEGVANTTSQSFVRFSSSFRVAGAPSSCLPCSVYQ